jgi:hypothetical protein
MPSLRPTSILRTKLGEPNIVRNLPLYGKRGLGQIEIVPMIASIQILCRRCSRSYGLCPVALGVGFPQFGRWPKREKTP